MTPKPGNLVFLNHPGLKESTIDGNKEKSIYNTYAILVREYNPAVDEPYNRDFVNKDLSPNEYEAFSIPYWRHIYILKGDFVVVTSRNHSNNKS